MMRPAALLVLCYGLGNNSESQVITEFPVPTLGSGPAEIAAGPDGNLWFTEGLANRIGRITTAGVITELPPTGRKPVAIAAGPDGGLWLTSLALSQGTWIERVTTNGDFTPFAFSVPPSDPSLTSIVAGPDGNLWFTVAGFHIGDSIGRITWGGAITVFPVLIDGNFTVGSEPSGIAAGPDGNMWFTEFGANQIGRITTSASFTCTSDAHALCLNDRRFSVTASFTQTPEGPSARAMAVRLTSDTGYFWFFDPANVELVVKILNGCTVDSDYWVFAGGLTSVGVELKVTDTRKEGVKTYSNAWGTAFQPIQDTLAFVCP